MHFVRILDNILTLPWTLWPLLLIFVVFKFQFDLHKIEMSILSLFHLNLQIFYLSSPKVREKIAWLIKKKHFINIFSGLYSERTESCEVRTFSFFFWKLFRHTLIKVIKIGFTFNLLIQSSIFIQILNFFCIAFYILETWASDISKYFDTWTSVFLFNASKIWSLSERFKSFHLSFN